MLKRRDFLKLGLKATAAAALPTIIPASALGRDGAIAPSERIVMAQIGYGGRGRQMLDNFLPWPQVQFVAACETQTLRLNACKARIDAQYGNTDCAVFRDLREMLARPDLDAVLITTGERWHTPASILAARAGKDIYSEKPVSLTLAEGRRLVEEVERHGVIYQGGTQRRNVGNFAAAVELARSGRLGRLKTLYASINGFETADDWLPPEPLPPPAQAIDWEMWLGSAPWRPYNHAYTVNAGGWRNYTDLGGGGITDWGCHSADLCQWAHGSDLTGPKLFERQGNTVVATYADGVRLVFKDNIGPGTCGIRLEGEEGWVYTADELDLDVSSKSLMPHGYKKEAWTRVVGHVKDFLDCVKMRRRATIHPELAHRSVSICHVANLCVRLGRPLAWDPAKEEFVGDAEANRLRARPSRLSWLPL